MESSSCSTSDRGRVTLVMVTVPALMRVMLLVEPGLLTITRVTRPLPLVEQELITITGVTRHLSLVE
jgi:hypothetical protein